MDKHAFSILFYSQAALALQPRERGQDVIRTAALGMLSRSRLPSAKS